MNDEGIRGENEDQGSYYDQTIQEKNDINDIKAGIFDVEACFERQIDESYNVRKILEFYCHQHAYVTYIMDECRDILVDETRLPYGYTFFIEDGQDHHY